MIDKKLYNNALLWKAIGTLNLLLRSKTSNSTNPKFLIF